MSHIVHAHTSAGGVTLQREDSKLDDIEVSQLFTDQTPSPLLPVIAILGPPGCGKGTLCKRLATDFNLHHMSVGDWLREQARPPIAGVPEYINQYVFEDVKIPQEILTAEFGREENMPVPLILYNCEKRKISAPRWMKVKAMPALKEDLERISKQSSCRARGILLDNLQNNLSHVEAVEETFGAEFPTLVITVDCTDETAKARFVARGRGSDDVARFERRIARFRKDMPVVVEYYEETGVVVRTDTECDADEAYQKLLCALNNRPEWRKIVEGCV